MCGDSEMYKSKGREGKGREGKGREEEFEAKDSEE